MCSSGWDILLFQSSCALKNINLTLVHQSIAYLIEIQRNRGYIEKVTGNTGIFVTTDRAANKSLASQSQSTCALPVYDATL
eukprot:c18303_g2_i2 orf=370-612(+)